MHVIRFTAAALAVILLIQSPCHAQVPLASEAQPVSREQGVRILLTNLALGTEVRVEARDKEVVGRLVKKGDAEIVVLASGQRLQIGIADVISIRRPLSREKSGNGTAFAIGAAVGTALLAVVLLVGAVASR